MRTLLAVTTVAAVLSAVAYQYWFRPTEEELWLLRMQSTLQRISEAAPSTMGEWQEIDQDASVVSLFGRTARVFKSWSYKHQADSRVIEVGLTGGQIRDLSIYPGRPPDGIHLHDRTIELGPDRSFDCYVCIFPKGLQIHQVLSFVGYTKSGDWKWLPNQNASIGPTVQAFQLRIYYKTLDELDEEALGEKAVEEITEFLEDFLPHLDPLFTEQP